MFDKMTAQKDRTQIKSVARGMSAAVFYILNSEI